jgi:endonuclease-3 related protein
MDAANNEILATYHALLDYYGQQSWWPAEDEFEVMVGAILTQNTAWTNVEKAITNLKKRGLCDANSMADVDQQTLAEVIRPSGYYNQKAQRLIRFARWYRQQGEHAGLSHRNTKELRAALLDLNGIGDETADDIVLYAFDKPSFVIDSYTRRLFSRLGLLKEKENYATLQQHFHAMLKPDVALFQQYHALIVSHAKRHCLKKPRCSGCPLTQLCNYNGDSQAQ